MIKVYGVQLSPFVRKVLLALEYKGIPYESISVMPGAEDPEFRAISPLGKIPVLEHDGFTIPDTSVICRYLDCVFPEDSIYPSGPKLEAQACWLEEFADSKLIDACAGLFRERFLNPNMLGTPTDEDKVKDILDNQMPPLLGYLESQMPDTGPLIGDSVSIADIAVLNCFLQAKYGNFEVDGSQYWKLAGYLDRVTSNEVVQKRMAAEADAVKALADSLN